jgi:hypothetical protein
MPARVIDRNRMSTATESSRWDTDIPEPTPLGALHQSTYEPEDVLSRFASETHAYISDSIRFADEKAAFFSGASAAMLYLLFNSHAERYLSWSLNSSSMHSLIGIAAMVALSMACIFGISVVTPRRRLGLASGHIFFDAIIQSNSRETFAAEVMQLSKEQLIAEKLMHSYDLAKVCNRKYRAQTLQLFLMIAGLILAAPYLLFLPR